MEYSPTYEQYVYKKATTKLSIPRTSASQYKISNAVKQNALKQDDLVFYATAKKGVVTFVGIYNENGPFISATSKGVKVIKMSDRYWKDRYIGVKRVIK